MSALLARAFMVMKFALRISLLMFLLFPWAIFAQVGSLRIVSGSVCTGIVETPILASQINGMAAMSIRILFDSAAISYQGVRNVHPAVASAALSGANSRFVMAWFSLQAVSLANDTLVVIRWANNGGRSSTLQFDTQTPGGCEIANVQAQVLPVQYISGQASITGAQAPVPLNPLHLTNLNQPNYLFVYRRPACIQQSWFQLATDSLFQQVTYSAVLIDTFYRHMFSGIVPSQGDSIRWWRMGGVFNGDTAWSATGRMSFALSLGGMNQTNELARLFPNPFREAFKLSHPAWLEGELVLVKIFGLDGRLIEEQRVQSQTQTLNVEIKNTAYHGQLLIYWQNLNRTGLVLANKVGY